MNTTNNQLISVKVTHNKLALASLPSVEKILSINRTAFDKVKSKEGFSDLLSKNDVSVSSENNSLINYLRKSKKRKEYVPLESEEDFKSLARSLKVKNHVKLIINDKTPIIEGNYKKRKTSSIDFAGLGDALLEAALEHFKEIFADLPVHETPSSEEGKNLNGEEESVQKVSIDDSILHENVACDSCSRNVFIPIKGRRYCCLVCPDFDLCEACATRSINNKQDIGEHGFSHPLAMLQKPDKYFNQKKFNFSGHLPGSGCPSDLANGASNVVVYDIPLENCNSQTKERLEELLQRDGIDLFIANVSKYIENSDRYEELVSLSQNGASVENDDDMKFVILKSMIDNCTNDSTGSKAGPVQVPEASVTPFESIPVDSVHKVLVKPKKISNHARVISLMLTNTSEVTINGGDFKFEFFNDTQKEIVVVKNASKVKPGQQRFYNLGRLNDSFNKLSGMKLRLSAPNAILEGDYNETDDSELLFVSMSGSLSKQPPNEPHFIDGSFLDNNDEVIVTVVPKSSSTAQIMISNKSDKIIDCSYLKLEIVNCFNRSVVTVIVRKKHGIHPGKVGKFNIGLIDAHMKYPFKLVMKNDFNIGYCDLSINNLIGKLTFEKEPSIEIDDQTGFVSDDETHTSGTESILQDQLEMEEVDADTRNDVEIKLTPVQESEASSIMGSIYSIVLPSLPKDVPVESSNSEYVDAQSSSIEHAQKAGTENLEDDYDIVSVEGDAESDSDFELLSPLVSNQ